MLLRELLMFAGFWIVSDTIAAWIPELSLNHSMDLPSKHHPKNQGWMEDVSNTLQQMQEKQNNITELLMSLDEFEERAQMANAAIG